MSLVNDALRRARQAQKKSSRPPAISPAPRHVEPVCQNSSSSGIPWSFAIVALLVVTGCVLWFAWRAGGPAPSAIIAARAKSAPASSHTLPSRARPTQPTPTPAVVQPVAIAAGNAPEADAPWPTRSHPGAQRNSAVLAANFSPAPVSAPASASAQVEPASPESVAVSTSVGPTVTQPVVVATGPPPPPPLPKLQGIVYRPGRPTALLDGKTVLIGRTSGGYQVVGISEQTVTVVRAGHTNILELPD